MIHWKPIHRRSRAASTARAHKWARARELQEDRWYRLSPSRRARLITGITASQYKTLPPDHPAIAGWRWNQHRLGDRALVNVAKAHHVSSWWVPFLLFWNAFQSIDIFQHACSATISRIKTYDRDLNTEMLVLMRNWALRTVTEFCVEWRMMKAQVSVPAFDALHAHASLSTSTNIVKVCAWNVGIAALDLWRVRRLRDLVHTVVVPWKPILYRTALAAVLLLSVLCPDLGAFQAPAGQRVLTAALAAATTWEFRTAGNDLNGGAFVTGAAGTDYSQQDAANSGGADSSTTDAVTNGTTTVTSATAAFGTTIVGNVIYLAGGTGSVVANRYQVTARASSTSITVDRSTGLTAGTGVTMNIGGAMLSPGILASGAPTSTVAGNTVYIKTGTYAMTTTAGSAGGVYSLSLANYHVEGYQTTRGDLGTRPVLQASGISTTTLFIHTGDGVNVANLDFDGAGLTAIRGAQLGAVVVYRCRGLNCLNNGLNGDQDSTFDSCITTGCTTQTAFSGGNYFGCVGYENTVSAFGMGRNNHATACLADSNSGATTDGFLSTQDGVNYNGSIAYGNGDDGYDGTSSDSQYFINCIAEGQTGVGYVAGNRAVRKYCAAFDNDGGDTSGTFGDLSTGNVTGTATFFTDAPNQDFTLNNTAGGGAELRAMGWPGALILGGTGYRDIGPLQHQDSGSGDTFVVSVTNAQVMDRGGRVGY